MMVIETNEDPMQWLQQSAADAVESAEVGIDRLEDLYQLLLEDADNQMVSDAGQIGAGS